MAKQIILTGRWHAKHPFAQQMHNRSAMPKLHKKIVSAINNSNALTVIIGLYADIEETTFSFLKFQVFAGRFHFFYFRFFFLFPNVSRNVNILGTRKEKTFHHSGLILETETDMETETKSCFHYLCLYVF